MVLNTCCHKCAWGLSTAVHVGMMIHASSRVEVAIAIHAAARLYGEIHGTQVLVVQWCMLPTLYVHGVMVAHCQS